MSGGFQSKEQLTNVDLRSTAKRDIEKVKTQPSGKTNVGFFDGHAEPALRTDLPTVGTELSNSTPTALMTAQHGKFVWRLDQN